MYQCPKRNIYIYIYLKGVNKRQWETTRHFVQDKLAVTTSEMVAIQSLQGTLRWDLFLSTWCTGHSRDQAMLTWCFETEKTCGKSRAEHSCTSIICIYKYNNWASSLWFFCWHLQPVCYIASKVEGPCEYPEEHRETTEPWQVLNIYIYIHMLSTKSWCLMKRQRLYILQYMIYVINHDCTYI